MYGTYGLITTFIVINVIVESMEMRSMNIFELILFVFFACDKYIEKNVYISVEFCSYLLLAGDICKIFYLL